MHGELKILKSAAKSIAKDIGKSFKKSDLYIHRGKKPFVFISTDLVSQTSNSYL